MVLYRVDGTRQEYEHEKFSCAELIEFFHGWFTLRYVRTDEDGTDLFLVTRDPHDVPATVDLGYNKIASAICGWDVLGDAILCTEVQIK